MGMTPCSTVCRNLVFQGKTILVDPVAMLCSQCNRAFMIGDARHRPKDQMYGIDKRRTCKLQSSDTLNDWMFRCYDIRIIETVDSKASVDIEFLFILYIVSKHGIEQDILSTG